MLCKNYFKCFERKGCTSYNEGVHRSDMFPDTTAAAILNVSPGWKWKEALLFARTSASPKLLQAPKFQVSFESACSTVASMQE